jgi:hypothetical protein
MMSIPSRSARVEMSKSDGIWSQSLRKQGRRKKKEGRRKKKEGRRKKGKEKKEEEKAGEF